MSAKGDARDTSGVVRIVGVEAGGEHYAVHIGAGLLERLGALYGRPAGVALVVCDENVAPLYLERVVAGLGGAGLRTSSIVLPPGEQTKSMRLPHASLRAFVRAGRGP